MKGAKMLSHPAWGAWIEIYITNLIKKTYPSRTPHGVRGLKSDAPLDLALPASRTPHGVRGLK